MKSYIFKRLSFSAGAFIIGMALMFIACPNADEMFATVNALDLTPLVDVPVTGEDRTTSFQAQDQYTGTISWQTVNNDGTTTAFTGPIYTSGTIYRAVVSLNAKTGFTFSGVAANSFTHSGATTVKNTANSGNVTITFPATTESDVRESGPFSSAVGANKLTVTLTGGTFAVSLVIGQFTITTPGNGGFANLTGGTVTRNSDTQVTITGLQAVTTAGSGQKLTVAASAQATQASSVSVVASTESVITTVESAAFSSAVGDNNLTITLDDGTFVISPKIGHFTITTPGTGGFANLTGGIVARNSDTQVTITGLQAVTTAGSGQKLTVAASAQATQASSVSVVATTIPQWTAANIPDFSSEPFMMNLRAITYGNGKFVTVGACGKILYSTDGVTWTAVTNTTFDNTNDIPNIICGIVYDGKKFLAVSHTGKAAFSSDSINWTAFTDTTLGGLDSICDIIYGGGKFIAVGVSGIAYSSDDISWNAVKNTTFPSGYPIQGIAYGDEKFVAVTSGSGYEGVAGHAAYSNDGITWISIEDTKLYRKQSIVYGGGKFIAAGGGPAVYSTDGITWTTAGDTIYGDKISTLYPSPSPGGGIAYGDGKFVAETGAADASGTLLAYSTDGITWTIAPITPFGGYTVYDIAYGNGKFVAVGAGQIAYWITP